MRSLPPHSTPYGLIAALFGMVLIGAFGPAPATALTSASTAAPAPPETMLRASGAPAPVPATQQETAASADYGESAVEQVLEVLLVVFLLLPFLALLLAVPATVLAVSLVMDGGCLRYLLFLLGWLFAIFYGLLVGAVVGEALLGLEALVGPIAHVFVWGYPIAAWWVHKKFQAMPREQYRAWDQSLTGGALLGFGAGSVASLLRSVFTLKSGGFGGFGGGSFGGGGASGSWSGAAGVAGSASSATTGTAAGAGSSAQAAAVSAGVAPGVAGAEASPDAATDGSGGLVNRLRQWADKFQWYHGLAFLLVALVFLPLGLGTVRALQNTEFFVFVLACTVVYTGYRLLQRNPDVPRSALRSISSFRGGEASSSWS